MLGVSPHSRGLVGVHSMSSHCLMKQTLISSPSEVRSRERGTKGRGVLARTASRRLRAEG